MNKTISTEAMVLGVFFGLVQILIVGALTTWAYLCNNFILAKIGLIILILLVVFLVLSIVRQSVSIKITEGGLLIKHFRKSEIINFDNIHEVSGGWVGPFRLPTDNVVKIKFKKPTKFGYSIKFIPAIDLDAIANAWRPIEFEGQRNYIIKEIEALIEKAKS
jgi:hypothetical protein